MQVVRRKKDGKYAIRKGWRLFGGYYYRDLDSSRRGLIHSSYWWPESSAYYEMSCWTDDVSLIKHELQLLSQPKPETKDSIEIVNTDSTEFLLK